MVHLSVEGRENAVDTLTGDQLIEILLEEDNSRMNAFFVRYVLTGCGLA